jgi:hypothetical protein
MAAEPDGGQQRRLEELARWHDEWVAKHEATTPFRPDDNTEPDYNLFYVDLEASQEAQDEFMMRAREIMGLDPVTGLPVEPGK